MKKITKHEIRSHGFFVKPQGFRREGMKVIQSFGNSAFTALQNCLGKLTEDGWDVSTIENYLCKTEKKDIWKLETYSKDYQDNAVYWVSIAVTDAIQPKMDINAFKTELAALLEKYDVHMYLHMEGDTHGIYEDNIRVVNNKNGEDWHIINED